ncbi:family 78 glycoside hydrolase catalytic domain [Microbacterium sp. A84]|uniref:family 78 glycoside hydrolase catalytic domain n=1 Tax=Microbacterium sp. A84 TaxID=3450715 RepID=UPI003F42868F
MSTPVHIESVSAERRRDTPFVATDRPRLSWIVDSAPSGWKQARAQVRLDGAQVAHLEGDDHVFVTWPFAPLQDDAPHTIELRVVGANDQASDWSAPLVVRLAQVAEWKAPFIGLATPTRPAHPVLLSRTIDVAEGLVSAVMHVSALGIAAVTIDDTSIDDSVLGPGWTSYDSRVLHDTMDVLPLLSPGSHDLRVALTGGWYTEEYGFGPQGTRVYGEQPAVAAELHLRWADGRRQVIGTDASWHATGTWQVVDSGIYAGETVDLRRDPVDHAPAVIIETPLVPIARGFEPVRRIETIAPVSIERTSADTYRLDFGQNLVGNLRLSVNGPEGTEITVRHAEVLENGELATRPLRRASATDRYILDGGGHRVLEPMGTFHGFRFAEISGWPGELDPRAIVAVVIHTDMRRTAWFDSSAPLLNRLHENVVWSMRGNFLSVPSDCPQRDERMGWTGDAQVFAPTAATLFDCDGFLSNWLEDLAFEQSKRDGIVPFVVPDVLRFPVAPTAAWGDAATVIPTVLADRFGDEAVLVRQFDSMRAWVDSILPLLDADGLWANHNQLGDWLDPLAPPDAPSLAQTPGDIVATAYLFRSADLVARTAARVGRPEFIARYAAIAERTRQAFLAAYVTPLGRMTADAPTAYALALVFGISTDPRQRRALGDRLAHVSRRTAFHIATGFVGTPLVLDALVDTGHVETAGRLLLQTGYPSWLYPVTMGATTVWERWDSMLPDGSVNPGEMTSFNHYAFGAVVDWLHRRVAGVTPIERAYRRIRFAPTLVDGLEHAATTIDTPSGRVIGGWERSGKTIALRLTVPVHSTAEVVLPDGTAVEVGHGTHSWTVPAPTGRSELPLPSLESTFREIADDADALATVLATLEEQDPAYAALARRRIDWNVEDPLPAGLYDMPPAAFGALAGALGNLAATRSQDRAGGVTQPRL